MYTPSPPSLPCPIPSHPPQVAAAHASGAAALAVVNSVPGPFSLSDAPDPDPAANPGPDPSLLGGDVDAKAIPATSLDQDPGQAALASLAAGRRVLALVRYVPPPPPYDDVADYSAYGPTLDQRIKPDLVAPGSRLLSAFTDFMSSGASDNCRSVGPGAVVWGEGGYGARAVGAGCLLLLDVVLLLVLATQAVPSA